MFRKFSILCLFLSPLFANAQPNSHVHDHFWKVKDTLYVRGPAVVGYMMPDTMMERMWSDAKTPQDSGDVEIGMDDFGWYMGTCSELLDKWHIPNTFDEARFIRIIGTRKSPLIDRANLSNDPIIISRSGGWKEERGLLFSEPAAVSEMKRFLH
jgi:hypothetical protein